MTREEMDRLVDLEAAVDCLFMRLAACELAAGTAGLQLSQLSNAVTMSELRLRQQEARFGTAFSEYPPVPTPGSPNPRSPRGTTYRPPDRNPYAPPGVADYIALLRWYYIQIGARIDATCAAAGIAQTHTALPNPWDTTGHAIANLAVMQSDNAANLTALEAKP